MGYEKGLQRLIFKYHFRKMQDSLVLRKIPCPSFSYRKIFDLGWSPPIFPTAGIPSNSKPIIQSKYVLVFQQPHPTAKAKAVHQIPGELTVRFPRRAMALPFLASGFVQFQYKEVPSSAFSLCPSIHFKELHKKITNQQC